MPNYTIKLDMNVGGQDTIVITDPTNYSVGQKISVSIQGPVTIGPPGGATMNIGAGASMQVSGTVTAKN